MSSERPPERDLTQGFGRGLTWASFGRGNGRGFYSQGLWREMKDTVKQRDGQILQVREEGGVMLLSTPLQPIVDIQGPLPLLPHQKIDSLQL